MKKYSYSKFIGYIFVAILAIVFILNIIIPDSRFSPNENRMLTELPNFSPSKYFDGRFEKKAESYADDQFVFRNNLIRIKTSADVAIGKLESNGVYRCKDNYLMEKIAVPDKHLQSTQSSMKSFKKKYNDLNMYFLLAPNAANILSGKLPFIVKEPDQDKYIEDFYTNIKSYGFTPIDVRNAFNNAKNDIQLYYRTDHHWTSDGAYLAFKTAAKTMKMHRVNGFKGYVVKNDFKGTLYSKSGFTNGKDDEIKIYLHENKRLFNDSVIYYGDTKKKTTNFYELDNLKKKDAYTVFGGSNHPMYTVSTPGVNQKTLLLIKDSYANSMVPFLAQNYKRVIVIDPRYYYESIGDLIKSYNVTDVMFLYNANTFFQDDSLEMLLTN